MDGRSPTLVLAAALGLVVTAPVHAQDARLPFGATPADWLAKPAPAAIERFYPELANDLDMGGVARINCRVSAQGLVERCRILGESPPGLGFGPAAVKLAPLFRFRPATTLVTAVPSQVVIPVRFVPPPDDVRRAIPFAALAALLTTLWARGVNRRRRAAAIVAGAPGAVQP